MALEDKARPCGHVELYLKEKAGGSVTPGGGGRGTATGREHMSSVSPGLAPTHGPSDSLRPFPGPCPPSLLRPRLAASSHRPAEDMEQRCGPELVNE